MTQMAYHPVLFKDLKGYLRRTDYFAGYTNTEKAWIRENLGLTSVEDVQQLIDQQVSGVKEVSYEDLIKATEEKTLIPGYTYVVKQFQSIYSVNGITYGIYNNPSLVWDIMLTAVTDSQLSKQAIVISEDVNSLLWEVHYDSTPEILPDGTKTKGKIIYLKDENGNEANYDFKNIIGEYGYTFKDSLGNENSKQCFNNNILYCQNVSFTGNSSHNFIKGENIHFTVPVNNLIGELKNVVVSGNDVPWESSGIKQAISISDSQYIDYLDSETLTHQLYALDNIQ